MFWVRSLHLAQRLEQPGRKMPKGRSDGSGGRANDNGRTFDGAHPARSGEVLGCKGLVALLQASDEQQLPRERTQLVAVADEAGNAFCGHWGEGRGSMNIILVSDSLAKSIGLWALALGVLLGLLYVFERVLLM